MMMMMMNFFLCILCCHSFGCFVAYPTYYCLHCLLLLSVVTTETLSHLFGVSLVCSTYLAHPCLGLSLYFHPQPSMLLLTCFQDFIALKIN